MSLVSSPMKPSTTIIQKIQPISSTTTTTVNTANYKVLSQQLPQTTTTSSIVIKPTTTTTTAASGNNNRIVITKTVSAEEAKRSILAAAGLGGGKVVDVIKTSSSSIAGPTTQISLTPIANSSNLNAIGKIKTSAFLNEIEKVNLKISIFLKFKFVFIICFECILAFGCDESVV